jgi:hypothetical protein
MDIQAENADLEKWHKHFAIECNNRAWDLSVQVRSPEQDREMLNCAHASAWHWAHIGTELNQMRARMLLAEVHALLGLGVSAFTYASEMRAYFLERETPDWEVAFTHAIYAHACLVNGKINDYRASYATAKAAIEQIADEEDRKIVLLTFKQIPGEGELIYSEQDVGVNRRMHRAMLIVQTHASQDELGTFLDARLAGFRLFGCREEKQIAALPARG